MPTCGNLNFRIGTFFNDITEEQLNICMCIYLPFISTSILKRFIIYYWRGWLNKNLLNIRALFYKTRAHQPQMYTYRSTFNVSLSLSIPIPKSFRRKKNVNFP
jgi:hypothetical protein